jgi:hypothetical protein
VLSWTSCVSSGVFSNIFRELPITLTVESQLVARVLRTLLVKLPSALSEEYANAPCAVCSARVSLDDEHSAVVPVGRAEDTLNLLGVAIEQAEQESLRRRV